VVTAISPALSTPVGPTDYCSWNLPLQEMLAGCVVSYPSKILGCGRLEFCADRRALAERLRGVPGVSLLPREAPVHKAEIFIPYNLFVMGQRAAMLEQYLLDAVETTPSGLKLKPYQRQSVTFLRAVDAFAGGALLGADAGTGKSIAALQALWLDGYLHKPGLVVGPLGAQGVWCGERSDAMRHYGLNIIPLEGTTASDYALRERGWYFIHYDVLQSWQSWLFSKLRPTSIIFDECHMCLNAKGQRYKAALVTSGSISTERRYGLTGTPIPKTRHDLFGQLAILQPGQWGSWFDFGIRHLGGKKVSHHEGGHWVFEDQTNTDELRARLAGVYLRYSKFEVATDLPTLHRHRVDVELPEAEAKEYRQARSSIVKWMEAHKRREAPEKIMLGSVEVTVNKEELGAKQLVTTSVLRSILDRGKLQHAAQVVQELVLKHRRIVVFTWKRDSAATLVKQLQSLLAIPVFGPIDGTDPWPKRRAIAAEFAVQPRAVFIATRGAVGIAINDLSAADACIQVTPDWNPDGNLQAESRLHREGAASSEIHSYYMLTRGTLDDRVMQLLNAKSHEAKSITPTDRAGLNLVNDLDPTLGDEGWTMEELCSLLQEIEEF